jgi:hypothetical protein
MNSDLIVFLVLSLVAIFGAGDVVQPQRGVFGACSWC